MNKCRYNCPPVTRGNLVYVRYDGTEPPFAFKVVDLQIYPESKRILIEVPKAYGNIRGWVPQDHFSREEIIFKGLSYDKKYWFVYFWRKVPLIGIINI